jgi:hypothetical protein
MSNFNQTGSTGGAYHSFGFGFYNNAAPTALGFNIENLVRPIHGQDLKELYIRA